jgi:hypothetical protein
MKEREHLDDLRVDMIVRIIVVVGSTVFLHTLNSSVDFGRLTLPATCFFLVSSLTYTSALKKDATCSSETGVATQKTALFVVTVVRT